MSAERTTAGAPEVAPVARHLDQPRVDRYAAAARDPNPIHRDSREALASQFGRPIAHGMLVLALVSEGMTAAFGERWATGGTLRVRWRAPAVPPVTVTARARARGVADGVATYDVSCEAEGGEVLLTGTATVPLG
ncbi:MAG: MaoC family dehydratase [Candidatus Rokubacteria bacterium]|nr:MaoC family dehydratase [Candidatus Rokubacteria bacterium]